METWLRILRKSFLIPHMSQRRSVWILQIPHTATATWPRSRERSILTAHKDQPRPVWLPRIPRTAPHQKPAPREPKSHQPTHLLLGRSSDLVESRDCCSGSHMV